MKPEFVDITPTWLDILPGLVGVIQDGSAEGKIRAFAELQRMAKAADLFNAITKKEPKP